MGTCGIEDGASIALSLSMAGGVGKPRISEDDDDLMLGTPSILETDIQAVKNAFGVTNVDIETWVKSLSLENITSLCEGIEKSGSRNKIVQEPHRPLHGQDY